MSDDLDRLAELAEAATEEGSEKWLPVKGYEGYYEVSDSGRVRSLEREVSHSRCGSVRVRGGMMSLVAGTKRGYLNVRLQKDGRSSMKLVHRLVAEAHIPNPRALPLVLHWDDDPANNRVANLRWGTHRDNNIDRERNGNGNEANRKSSCRFGHEYTPDNTYMAGKWRRCRTCTNAGQARRYRERKGRHGAE